LKKNRRDDQLVKYKDTGTTTYTYRSYKIVKAFLGKQWVENKENIRIPLLLHEVLTNIL